MPLPAKRTKKSPRARREKMDEMHNHVQAAIMMTVDDQVDAVNMALIMLTAGKNMLVEHLGEEKTLMALNELAHTI